MKWISASKACQTKRARRRGVVCCGRTRRARPRAARRRATVLAREVRVVLSKREGGGGAGILRLRFGVGWVVVVVVVRLVVVVVRWDRRWSFEMRLGCC